MSVTDPPVGDPPVDEEFAKLLARLLPYMTDAALAAVGVAAETTPVPVTRPGEVTGVDSTARTATVLVDGDTAPITAQVLTELPGTTDRVMVTFGAKGAVFVTGFITACGVPPGSLQAYAGPITAHAGAASTTATPGQPPRGWLWCAGQAVSRSTYSALYNAIGTTHGVGDGATTFNVPDYRGRTLLGLDNMGGSDASRLSAANTLGGTGGAESVSIATGNLPPHNHDGSSLSAASDGSHTHSIDPPTNGTLYASGPNGGGSGNTINSTGSTSTSSGGSHTHSISGTTGNTGSGTALTVLPPYLLCHIIIKA